MTLEERFEIFWKAYPRKVGKLDCLKIWKRKKYDEETLDQMLEALKWQVNLEQWKNKAYVPHPSTWLNQGRWLDEMDTSLMVGSGSNSKKSQQEELMELVAENKRKMGIV